MKLQKGILNDPLRRCFRVKGFSEKKMDSGWS